MKKLELKHLASYLPYGLKILYKQTEEQKKSIFKNYREDGVDEMGVVTMMAIVGGNKQYKPILRPLSDLTKEDYINDILGTSRMLDGGTIRYMMQPNGITDFWEATPDGKLERLLDYSDYQNIFKLHFDVFGLIEEGLAIDINALDK